MFWTPNLLHVYPCFTRFPTQVKAHKKSYIVKSYVISKFLLELLTSWGKTDCCLVSLDFLMLRLCNKLPDSLWNPSEVEEVENVLPHQSSPTSAQTYSICKLAGHPLALCTLALNLFIFRCCNLAHLVVHLPTNFHETFGTLWITTAKVMHVFLKSPQTV